MRSSISSSDIRALKAPWPATWAATALLTLLLLTGWEAFWRVEGFKPTIMDDAGLWSAARHSVRPESTVLVGSSLMNAAVHLSSYQEVSGTLPVQLSVNGGRTYLLLENLARDPRFKGTVICELTEGEILDELTTSREKEFISLYERETPAGRSESHLQRLAQQRLALASPNLSLRMLVEDALKREWPTAFYPHYSIGEDRSLSVDFSKADVEKLRARVRAATQSLAPSVGPAEFVARAHRFEALAEEIERRGGRVIFVRMPFSGAAWEAVEKAYPKAVYWDEFARRTRFRTIHFKDYPELQVECPDYIHVDMRDSVKFTIALAKIIYGEGRP